MEGADREAYQPVSYKTAVRGISSVTTVSHAGFWAVFFRGAP